MNRDEDFEAAVRRARQERDHLTDGDLILWVKVECNHVVDYQVRASRRDNTASVMTEPPRRR